jgi:hypothetical protein
MVKMCIGLLLLLVLGASPAAAQSDSVFYTALSAAAAGHAADLVSHYKGGGREGNPVLAWADDSPATLGTVKVGIAATSLWATHKLWKQGRKRTALTIAVGQAVTTVLVARHNMGLRR